VFILFVNPIGGNLSERYEYNSIEVAHKEFEWVANPALAIEVWLLYAGPNPLFPARHMTQIVNYWHRSQEVR
jgi:hypothetical protein